MYHINRLHGAMRDRRQRLTDNKKQRQVKKNSDRQPDRKLRLERDRLTEKETERNRIGKKERACNSAVWTQSFSTNVVTVQY